VILVEDLRVPFANYETATTLIEKLTALFARLQPVIWNASDDSEEEMRTALAQLTNGQRMSYAVEQLQMEVCNGGFDQFFFNSAGALAHDALEGLRLLQLGVFASLTERAMAFFPDGSVPRGRNKRQDLLAAGVSKELESADLDSKWYAAYAGEEQISKAVLAYVVSHPDEFFVDAH
jgi:hypothetical protein